MLRSAAEIIVLIIIIIIIIICDGPFSPCLLAPEVIIGP